MDSSIQKLLTDGQNLNFY